MLFVVWGSEVRKEAGEVVRGTGETLAENAFYSVKGGLLALRGTG